jgi:hypothetical protein
MRRLAAFLASATREQPARGRRDGARRPARSPVEGALAAETVASVVVVLDGEAAGGRHRLAVGVAGGLVAAVDPRSGASALEVSAGGPGREFVRLTAVARDDEHGRGSLPVAAVAFAAPVCAGSVSLVVEGDCGRPAGPRAGARLVAPGVMARR